MTPWTKVILATIVAVLGLIGFNLAVWRRLRAARAQEARRGEDGRGGDG